MLLACCFDKFASVSSPTSLGDKLPPVLLLLVIKYVRCCCYQLIIIASVVFTTDKLIAGVMESMEIRNKA
jgi:hypothetical protein